MNPPRPDWIGQSLRTAERTVIRNVILAGIATAGLIWLFSAGTAHGAPIITCDKQGCSDRQTPAPTSRRRTRVVDASGNAVVVGGRPAGCPHRYCGCEASLYVFGKIRPELNLAYNWVRKFPRTSPAPGMVAARRGHVMVLISHVEGSNWLTHDGNSGGGLTRRHVQSIKRFVIVDPRGVQSAVLQ